MKTKVCIVCDKKYTPNSNRQRYCSICGKQHAREAKNAARRLYRQMHRVAPQAKICLNCGNTYIPASGAQKYCLDCRSIQKNKVCKDHNIARWERIKQSPELHQSQKNALKKYREAHKDDPVYRARIRESSKKAREARKKDPVRMARFRAAKRLWWAKHTNDPAINRQHRIKGTEQYAKDRIDPEYMALRNSKRALSLAKEKEGLNAVPFFQAMAAAAAINDK